MSGSDSSSAPTANAPAHEATLMKYGADLAAYGLEEIQVSTEHKSLRANDRTLFDDKSANSGYVKFSRDYLALDWHIVDFAPSKSKSKPASADDTKLPEQTFEVDKGLDAEDKEPETNAITKVFPRAKEANDERTRLFATYHMPLPKRVDDRLKPLPYEERLGEEVAVNCTDLSFKFGSVEPFFCSIHLYDYKEARKISEDFVFDLNSPEAAALIGQSLDTHATLRVKKAIFRLSPTSKHSQIFLVIVVNKVLKGDIDQQYEVYSKSTWKDKERAKVVAEIQESCRRLAPYRQAFVWGAAPLFSDENNYHDGVLNIDLVRIKGDVNQLIDDFTNPKKKRDPLGTFSCDISNKPSPMVFANRLTPSLAPIYPFDEKSSDRTKEVQEFTSTNEYPYPHVAYVNNYYFYLQKVDLSALPASVSHRNICVEVKVLDNDRDHTQPGMPIVYGTAFDGEVLTSHYLSSVTYHNEAPKLLDEIAIKLPVQVHDRHHLLITYYHVNCKPPKSSGKSEQVMTPVAYSVIKLLKDHQIIRQKNIIRIATKLEPGYLSSDEKITYLDNKKAQLTMYARVISSIYPLEGALHKFLRTCEWDVDKETDKIVAAMRGLFDEKTNRRQIVRYLPVALRGLFQQIACANSTVASEGFTTLLGILSSVAQLTKPKDAILEAYVQYVFDYAANQTPRPLYERLMYWWLQTIKEHDDSKNQNWLRFSWFLFGIIAKSMAFTLKDCGMLKDEGSRPKRFTNEQVDLLSSLVNAFGELVRDNHKLPALAGDIPRFNVEIAHFFTDLLRMMDRGVVFGIINEYLLRIQFTLEEYAFKFLVIKVLAQDPQYVPLSLPGHSPTFKSVREVPKRFYNRHILVGLVLSQVESGLSSGSQPVATLAIDTLCDVLWMHDNEHRLDDSQRRRVAQMYFPFVLTVIDQHEALETAPEDFQSKVMACFMWVLQGLSESLMREYIDRESEKRLFTFLSLIEKALHIFRWQDKQYAMVRRAVPLEPNKHFTVGYIDPGAQYQTLRQNPLDTSAKQARPALSKAAFLSPDSSPSSSSSSIAKKATRKDVSKKDKKRTSSQRPESADSPEATHVVKSVQRLGGLSERAAIKEANYVREISRIALDVCLSFVKNAPRMLRTREPFEKVFSVLMALLRHNQPSSFLSVFLEKLFSLIQQFSSRLFAKSNSITPELVYHVLRLCNSSIDSTRNEAASLYAFLFEQNFAEVKNVDRVRLQTTIGVIKLLGGASRYSPLLNSVKSVKDHFQGNGAIAQIVDGLDSRIRSIISDHKKMHDYEFDAETMTDLYYQVSRQLIDSPDERITWLQNLAEYQLKQDNFEEAAQAHIITAALIQGYLKGFNRWNTKMVPAFHLVCPEIKDELSFPDFARLKAFKDEICQSSLFTADGFASLVKDAIELFKKGGYFESAAAAYRMLLPVYQESEDYEKQKQCHFDLYSICRTLTDEVRLAQRIFSNYYRVALYGEKLGPELDGKEFIYKEKNTLRLAELSENFKRQFGGKFGDDSFVLLQHNKPVVRSELDSSKVYMQLCAVDIYLTPEELEDRQSAFKQHFGAKRFVMETPFTKSGKAHGELDEQFLRRTIFTTDGAFPYLKKRLRVVNKHDVELDPIETAQNVFEKKIQALKSEVNQSRPNLKTLQMILQGTLLTQVNAGASAVIKTFLSDEAAAKFSFETRDKLADLVSEFVRLLSFGLKLNKSFMDPTNDQLVLHEELEKGYDRFDQLLSSCGIFASKKERYAGEDSSLSLSSSANAPDSISSVSKSSTKKLLSGSGSSDTPTRSGTRKVVAAVISAAEGAGVSAVQPAADASHSPRSPRSESKAPKPFGLDKAKSTKLSKDKE